jgi:two-component sensor histidine kinase
MCVNSRNRCHCDERLIFDELTHRINNEWAVAIGIVSIAAARSPTDEVRSALASVLNHLESLARVHRALQPPNHDTCVEGHAYLQQLCGDIFRSQLECRGIKLVRVLQPFLLDSARCWRLGMILTELITNSVRHAFNSRGGVIRVEVQCRGSLAECRVEDDGSACEPIRHGRGLKIVKALARSLGGTFECNFSAQGAVSTVAFPVARPPETEAYSDWAPP